MKLRPAILGFWFGRSDELQFKGTTVFFTPAPQLLATITFGIDHDLHADLGDTHIANPVESLTLVNQKTCPRCLNSRRFGRPVQFVEHETQNGNRQR